MIRLKSVTKVYDNKTIALNDVTFSVKKGTIVGIIGRNGSGKSTMFKIISGVINDYKGNCIINGKKISLDNSEDVSYLPEVRGLDGRKEVLEHLTDMVCYKGIKRKVAEKSIIEWLKKFDLLYAKHSRIDTLSKGNQQKLQFIVAVSSKPKLLILDEPFSGLDTITNDIFWGIMEKLRNEGCTIIFSSHNLYEKMSCCDQFVFIRKGKIIENGKLEDIQKKYNMILELKNSSVDEKTFNVLFPNLKYSMIQDRFIINIEKEEMANEIFNKLPNKYSEIFYLRKMSLDELFREINLGGV